jgi:predicted transcriptional regulator
LNPEDEVKQSFKKSELKRIEKNIKKIIQKFVPKDTKSATVYVMTLLPTGELREFEVAASTQISAETVQKLFDAINEIEVPKSRANTIRYNLLFQVN